MFLVERTKSARRPRGAERFHESGTLEIDGWQKKNEEGRDHPRRYVEQIRFSLESLCSYSDVRWVSDAVLYGWEKVVGAARVCNEIEVLAIQGRERDLFDHDAPRTGRKLPSVGPEEKSAAFDHDEQPRWTAEAATALAELHYQVSGIGIDIPMVPRHLIKKLASSEKFFWTTDSELDLYLSLHFMNSRCISALLSAAGDSWSFGGCRGSLGLIARIGPFVVYQNHWYSNGHIDVSESDRQSCCSGIRAWNTSLVNFETQLGEEPRFLILFSTLYSFGVIRELEPGATAEPIPMKSLEHAHLGHGAAEFWEDIPGRTIYSALADAHGRVAAKDPVLAALQNSDDPVLAAAARHLGLLIEGWENSLPPGN
jgi:hypothetical protein